MISTLNLISNLSWNLVETHRNGLIIIILVLLLVWIANLCMFIKLNDLPLKIEYILNKVNPVKYVFVYIIYERSCNKLKYILTVGWFPFLICKS